MSCAAFRLQGVHVKPDVVIFLDGMNDVTLHLEKHGRATAYLKRMRQARDLALARGIKVIYAPQPFLPQKKHKTALEMIIQMESVRPLDRLLRGLFEIAAGSPGDVHSARGLLYGLFRCLGSHARIRPLRTSGILPM